MNERRRHIACTVLAAALVGLSVTACSSIPSRIAPPRVELVSLTLLEANVDHQRFAAELAVRNPNAFDIPIDGIDFSARLSGQGVLIGESAEATTLPAGGTERMRVEVTTELVSSLASMLAVVQGPDNAIPYELNGALRLASGIDRRVRFGYSGRVPLSSASGAAR